MTSYGYTIMIIVDSCMIWFNFDCVMQWKKSYHISTNVCSRKGAITFGDLPDWLVQSFISAVGAAERYIGIAYLSLMSTVLLLRAYPILRGEILLVQNVVNIMLITSWVVWLALNT